MNWTLPPYISEVHWTMPPYISEVHWTMPSCITEVHWTMPPSFTKIHRTVTPLNVSMVDTHLRKLLWVYCPGHARVKGNDRADRMAGEKKSNLASRKI